MATAWQSPESRVPLANSPEASNLRRLLANRISSIEQVEMLLLLARNPERTWTREDVASALGRPVQSTAMRLFLLSSRGFLDVSGTGRSPGYRYRPADAETKVLAELLLALWTQNPRAIRDALTLDGDARRARS